MEAESGRVFLRVLWWAGYVIGPVAYGVVTGWRSLSSGKTVHHALVVSLSATVGCVFLAICGRFVGKAVGNARRKEIANGVVVSRSAIIVFWLLVLLMFSILLYSV